MVVHLDNQKVESMDQMMEKKLVSLQVEKRVEKMAERMAEQLDFGKAVTMVVLLVYEQGTEKVEMLDCMSVLYLVEQSVAALVEKKADMMEFAMVNKMDEWMVHLKVVSMEFLLVEMQESSKVEQLVERLVG